MRWDSQWLVADAASDAGHMLVKSILKGDTQAALDWKKIQMSLLNTETEL